jgi:hypothetical protein
MRRAAVVLLLLAATISAQVPVAVDEVARIRSDFAPRAGEQTLNCDVTPLAAFANFAFLFEAGYVFHVSQSQYFEADGDWIVFTSIHPDGHPLEDMSLIHRVPRNRAVASGSRFDIRGLYFLGAGSYSVESTLRDGRDRVCRKQWRVVVPALRVDRSVPSKLPPYKVAQYSPIVRPDMRNPDDAAPVRLTVLLNAAAGSPRRTTIGSVDRERILDALTALLEHLPTTSVRVVAFSLEQQKEVLRLDGFKASDMNQISGAIAALPQATIDVNVLKNPRGHVDFLAGMIRRELDAPDPADTIVFLGPTSRYWEKLPKDALPPGQAHARVFYVRYERWVRAYMEPADPAHPRQHVAEIGGSRGQPDIISRAVAQLNGKTMIVHTPSELAAAIRKIEEGR